MKRTMDITDKFDSQSETEWRESNWTIPPHHTRDIRILITAGAMVTVLGLVGYGLVSSAEYSLRISRMRALYEPYRRAEAEIKALEFCRSSACNERRGDLRQEMTKAWAEVCKNDKELEFRDYLRGQGVAYPVCD